jgi:STE24 endopeptidase
MAQWPASNTKALRLAAILIFIALPAILPAQVGGGNTGQPGEPRAQVSPPEIARSAPARIPHGYTLTPEQAARATDYAAARRRIYFLDFGWSILALLLILHWHIGVTFRNWAERLGNRRVIQSIVFTPLLLGIMEIAGLPAAVARHRMALRYGLSVQGWTSWLVDLGKGALLQFAAGIFIVWLLYAVMRRSPQRWWLYGWLASVPILVFAVFISPWLVDPLFFVFTPLAPAHPELAAQIERVTARAGQTIPGSRMYVMNASSKLNALNAYVTGLGSSRRVVVWDTTINRLSEPEVLSVFSHEMGHYVLGHVRAGVAFAAAMMLAGFFAGSYLFRWAAQRRGSAWGLRGMDDWASLPALLLIFSLLNFVGTPAASAYSRHIEHQADQYGLEVLHGVVPDASGAAARSLQIMGEEDLEEPSPSPAVVFWFYTHPPINDRISFAYEYDPWTAGRSPEFVK